MNNKKFISTFFISVILLSAIVFGLFERFGTFSVVVFNAVLGMYLFMGKLEADNTWQVRRIEQ